MRARRAALLVRVGLVALALVANVACGSRQAATPTPTMASGIRGSVLLGPTCPVASPGFDTPCVTPYAATLVLTNDDGERVATTTSGPDGRFEFTVPPGQYVIAPQPAGDPFPAAQPVDVNVEPGQFVETQINYDTGIRSP